MTLNNREIIFVTYSTEGNWDKQLPKSNWLCVLVDNDRPQNFLNEVISKIINNDVCWVSTVGQSCEKAHDIIDEEIVFREVDTEELHLPKHNIMTTWDSDFDEGIWFAVFAATHEEVSIEKVVILDLTSGQENGRITKLLEGYVNESKQI